ncbi:heterokaryon incompatibility protein-domain-containing protein [Ampelomyces quisqualis]|uniref:Heterokaryon incompatibility protein-domain-containing protein n=1 Tax=Ampelomyces quisqualis TaxID=50730 RepID=A0A6A5QM08_AMPQU|nr:heterokaryon incompatibility protein-domain-containing protein [Ampelomyces quisqualis]
MKRVNALLNRSVPSKHEPSQTPTETRSFAHKPLDETKPSLRLVTVASELSSDGSIQCYVSHSTLDRASYVCLSYRWGDPGHLTQIHINGAPFHVRRNVYDFLDMVRRMPTTFYWIDAICIDQANVSERSHQVAHMGRIFSGAFLVYLWLGKMPLMTPWLHYLRNGKTQPDHSALPWSVIFEAQQTIDTCVFNNEYWSRAWVAQEVLLARSVIVLLCHETFEFTELVKTTMKFDNVDLGSFRDCAMAQFADLINGFGYVQPKTLVNLLDNFRDYRCEMPRDHIYSLLALSSESQLPRVDYNQPSEGLAYEVLKRSDEPLCICSALLVGHTLELCPEQHKREIVSPRTDTKTLIEFDIKGLRYSRHAMLANDEIQSWSHYKLMGTDMFGHDFVFSGFCPAFLALMNALQARTMTMDAAIPESTDDSALVRPIIPCLLRVMDDNHRHAMMSGFGPAVTIYAPNASADISTVQVALELIVELVPQTIELCSRIARSKEKTKSRGSEEVHAISDRDGPLHRMTPVPRRGTDWTSQSADFHRVDSANQNKSPEVEGPISRIRLWRAQFPPD